MGGLDINTSLKFLKKDKDRFSFIKRMNEIESSFMDSTYESKFEERQNM